MQIDVKRMNKFLAFAMLFESLVLFAVAWIVPGATQFCVPVGIAALVSSYINFKAWRYKPKYNISIKDGTVG